MALYNLEIPNGPFTTLVADPPWPYKDKLPGPKRGAAKHYPTMQLWEIRAMSYDIKEAMRDNAHLYLWAPNAFLHDAWEVAEAWGFQPKTILTWVKVTAHAAEAVANGVAHFGHEAPNWEALNYKGIARVGMGRGYRNCTEQVVVAVRGKKPMIRTDQPNVFFAPRKGHSEKPDIFYDIVESMSPGPYLELFAGRERPGWAYPTKGDSDNG